MTKKSKAETELRDMVSRTDFKKIENGFRKNYGMGLETAAINSKKIPSMCSRDCNPEFCKMVRASRIGIKRCEQDRIRSLNIAIETGHPYTTICHAGIVSVCIPIMDANTPLGGLFFGKCLSENFHEIIEADILKRLSDLKFNRPMLIEAAKKLKVIPGRHIHEASEFLFVLLYETTGLDPSTVQWRRQQALQQSQINEYIQENKKDIAGKSIYPYESEQKLIAKVKIGDRIGAKEILNSILGTIMFRNPGDCNLLKARLVELVTVLSRAAVEGGADMNILLEKNLTYFTHVLELNTQQELCSWISKALNEFIESVYNSQDSKKVMQLKPALDFIEANYDRQITLSAIAKEVHLSISRFAHLFKEQMGITLIDYLTNVRIGHAKRLLLSTDMSCTTICFEVGYNNQSYFTRTFKDIVGLTPRQFRNKNTRIT